MLASNLYLLMSKWHSFALPLPLQGAKWLQGRINKRLCGINKLETLQRRQRRQQRLLRNLSATSMPCTQRNKHHMLVPLSWQLNLQNVCQRKLLSALRPAKSE
ncbi:hypothetical protein PYCC9005_003984 [Savitreella phatthalungensis]